MAPPNNDFDEATPKPAPRFKIPLPGGRVACVPLDVLEQYVDPTAIAAHAATDKPSPNEPSSSGPGGSNHSSTKVQAGDSMITINIYTSSGDVQVQQHTEEAALAHDDDVVAHSLSIDPSTGISEWHTDYEYGECEYIDESGFPQRIQAWHNHPFGTEYTEIYEG